MSLERHTPNPETETLNPSPQALIPKPKTLKAKPVEGIGLQGLELNGSELSLRASKFGCTVQGRVQSFGFMARDLEFRVFGFRAFGFRAFGV